MWAWWPALLSPLLAALLTTGGDLRGQHALTWLAVGAGTLAAMGVARRVAQQRWSGRRVAAVAGVSMALSMAGSPTLSDDVWRYLWEGRAQRQGHATPYLLAPEDTHLPDVPPGSRARVAHPNVPAVYPPGAQVLLWGTAHLADVGGHGGPTAFQVVLGTCWLAAAWLAWRMANTAAQRGLAAGLAVHPLGLLEAGRGAHLDAAAALALSVMVVAWQARHHVQAGAAWAVALLIKPVAALLLIRLLLDRGRLPVLLGATLAGLVLVAPYAPAGAALWEGVGTYALHWEFNGGLSRVLRWVLDGPFEELAQRRQWLHLRWASSGVGVEQGGGWLWTWGAPPLDGARLLVDGRLLARVGGLGLLCVWLAWAWRALTTTPAQHALVTVLGLLAVSPTVHPWYVLTLLPLCALAQAPTLLWSSGVFALAYAVWRVDATGMVWDEPGWTAPIIWGVTAVAAARDFHRWRNPSSPTQPNPQPSTTSAGTVA